MDKVLLAERLKAIRVYLGLTQKELAIKLSNSENINISQNAISRIETAKGGDIDFFLILLNFYSKYINVDLIFSPAFEIINNEKHSLKTGLNSIVIAKLDLIKEDLDLVKNKIDSTKKLLE